MAENFFSDHFNNNTVPGVATLTGSLTYDAQRKSDTGARRVRRSRAMMQVGTGVVSGSQLRMIQMKAADRLYDIKLSSDGGATAGAIDIGVYKTGLAHLGAVVDVDLFASAQVITSAIDRVDKFEEASTLSEVDRGKYLWEQAAVGDGSDTIDPMEDWDIVLTCTTAFTVALTILILEVDFTSGD